MNIEVNNVNIFYIILITFVSSLILVPLIKDIAIHINAMDIPNKRKVHKKPMPRLGGLAVIAGFLISIAYLLIVMTIENKINLYEEKNNEHASYYSNGGFYTGRLWIIAE